MRRDYLRVAEAAPELGVTSGRLYQLIAAGDCPARRVGGSIQIPAEEFSRWLDERTRDARRSMDADGEGVG